VRAERLLELTDLLRSREANKAETRTFRVDRSARPRLLREPVFQPDLRVIQAQVPDHERWQPLTGRCHG
jgi:hypothetical protein